MAELYLRELSAIIPKELICGMCILTKKSRLDNSLSLGELFKFGIQGFVNFDFLIIYGFCI